MSQEHAVGMFLKAAADADKVAKEAEEKKKSTPPGERIEIWNRPSFDGVRHYDRTEVKIYRNKQGKFAPKPSHQQLAEHFGMKTGRDVPSPKKKRS